MKFFYRNVYNTLDNPSPGNLAFLTPAKAIEAADAAPCIHIGVELRAYSLSKRQSVCVIFIPNNKEA